MYLHNAKSARNPTTKQHYEDLARTLIHEKKVPLDTANSNVLLLSSLSDFQDGTILVREQQGLRFDIFRSYTSAKDTASAIKALHKYGAEEPRLYPAALAYFTSSPAIMAEAGDELDAVLKKIDDDGLMAPLQVIQTLSKNGVATMGQVKKYLSTTIARERKEIASNRQLISTYTSDTATKTEELTQLSTKPQTFNSTRCSACMKPLDLPAVHFLCKHSFHQRCLNVPANASSMEGSNDGVDKVECPICAPGNATVRAIRKAQEESKDRHELFQDALGRSSDKFGLVAEWFGRGVV